MVRRDLLKAMLFTASGLLLPASFAEARTMTRITHLRLWKSSDQTRLLFDLDSKLRYSLKQLTNPDRLQIELRQVEWAMDPALLHIEDSTVGELQLTRIAPGQILLECALKRPMVANAYLLHSSNGKPPRLVVELQPKEIMEEDDDPARASLVAQTRGRPPVIVIDPGHGGEDPGAIGHAGTYEKHVTLEVGNKLVHTLNASGFKAHLTRSDDYFVGLRKRVSIARKHGADLFVSLHADAFRIQSARGASVYCLSDRGKPEPDRALRSLVERENSADLIGGIDLGQVSDPELRDILMDLSQRDARNRAMAYGNSLLTSLKKVPSLRIHFRGVKQAGFAVLKAPDIPSVLVEMAFLSNRDEELQLRRSEHQDALVRALTHGTQAFFRSASLA
ncbi:MAG: N-acetylmuramoyl-L-alanine amidase [Magnetococcales bacterium]|nr:N-acetylmuramoyl-L-alanine amidase [Magnetococcales bacterium]MBF0116076.1 N-acetylmuramoyl-L-alanine amidase [Magnetococcales bacterium]